MIARAASARSSRVIVAGWKPYFFATAVTTCDLAGRYDGLWTLDVSPAECQPNGSGLTCPTRGLENFELMSGQGDLRPVYQNGATTIYEVPW